MKRLSAIGAAVLLAASMLAPTPPRRRTRAARSRAWSRNISPTIPRKWSRSSRPIWPNTPRRSVRFRRTAQAPARQCRRSGRAGACRQNRGANHRGRRRQCRAVVFLAAPGRLGNPQGDVTMVEFFDYNCGFCKRALGDMVDLLKAEPNLKIVLKEFPVLGPGSVEAARIAVAVRMQDPSGKNILNSTASFWAVAAGQQGAGARGGARRRPRCGATGKGQPDR